MKKSLLNLGKALNREEQKQIKGGGIPAVFKKECGDVSGPCCHIVLEYTIDGWAEVEVCEDRPN